MAMRLEYHKASGMWRVLWKKSWLVGEGMTRDEAMDDAREWCKREGMADPVFTIIG